MEKFAIDGESLSVIVRFNSSVVVSVAFVADFGLTINVLSFSSNESEIPSIVISPVRYPAGILICNPVPKKYSIPNKIIEKAINSSMLTARQSKIHGKKLTPFLLEKVSSITKGKTLETNIQLMLNNAKLAANICPAAVLFNALVKPGTPYLLPICWPRDAKA